MTELKPGTFGTLVALAEAHESERVRDAADDALKVLRERDLEVIVLRDMLKRCADELEAELRNRWQPDSHPHSAKKFHRDMDTVRAARALLDEGGG